MTKNTFSNTYNTITKKINNPSRENPEKYGGKSYETFKTLTTTEDIVYAGILNYSYKLFSYKNLTKLSIMLFT